MNKEYGRLTADQLRRLIRKLPEFRREASGFEDSLRSASPEKVRELLGDGFAWAPLYERPFVQVVGLLVYAIGQLERLKAIALLPDPQEVVLNEWEKLEENLPS